MGHAPWKCLNPELQADILSIHDEMGWDLRDNLSKKKLAELDVIIARKKAEPKRELMFSKEDIKKMTAHLNDVVI